MHRIEARAEIVNKLSAQLTPPELLLFGSSRCLRLRPPYNQRLVGLNVSLHAGAIEDHYCILHYAVDDLKYPVKIVVLGLEPDLMMDTHPTDVMLMRNDKLNPWLEQDKIPILQSFLQEPTYIKELSSLLSIMTIKNSGKVVFQYFLNKLAIESQTPIAKADSNLEKNTLIEKFVSAKDSMEARLRQYKKIYSDAINLSTARINYLYKFAQYAQKKRIRVIMFYPGYSKNFGESMNALVTFEKMHLALDGHIENLKKKFHWEILDFRPGNWEGSSLDFFDGVHPTHKTARIIDEHIEKLINYDI